jgi:hypothetical protein
MQYIKRIKGNIYIYIYFEERKEKSRHLYKYTASVYRNNN